MTTKLRKLRDLTGDKPKDIVMWIGVDRVRYWRVENAKSKPSFDLAVKIAKYWKLRGYAITLEEIFHPSQDKGDRLKIEVE